MIFTPTRNAGLARLRDFAPNAGIDYARQRNFVRPAHADVSGLSPYLRHRMITETEVLEAVLARHTPDEAEKFVQEVFWRTYWKGWLEQRPAVWTAYRADLTAALNRVQTEAGLRAEWKAACAGTTGIDGFDHWANELVETGYLHNHARMWFASIWIFTLRLPWTLGADFFLRHLMDGDAASNTLGWRWVAGLQTVGKTYLARPDNIAKYTEGRFHPTGLATEAEPLTGAPAPDRTAPPASALWPSGKLGLLVTEDDLSPDWLHRQFAPSDIAVLDGTALRSPLTVAPHVTTFVSDAVKDMETRIGALTVLHDPSEIDRWAARNGIDALVAPYVPVGATADALRALKTPIAQMLRPYDAAAWPHATAGFFKFKKNIPQLLHANDILSSA